MEDRWIEGGGRREGGREEARKERVAARHRFELRNAVISFRDVKSTPVSKFRVFFESPNAPNDKQVDG